MTRSPVEKSIEVPQTFHEACRAMMNGRALAVADHFGKSQSAVYSWAEDPRGSGRAMPGDMIVPVSLFLDDYRLIEWMANQVGLVVYRIPEAAGDHNFDRLAALTKEFGDGLQAAGDALKDGRITSAEFERIEKEFIEFITEGKRTLEAFRCQVKR